MLLETHYPMGISSPEDVVVYWAKAFRDAIAHDNQFTDRDRLYSRSWDTCCVGACARDVEFVHEADDDAIYSMLRPEDDTLYNLGVEFSEAVRHNNVELAMTIRVKIVARVNELKGQA